MTDDKKTIVDLGAMPSGSRPLSLVYQFQNYDGSAVDMSSGTWVGQGRAEELYLDGAAQPTGIGTGGVSVDDVTAIATYDWATEDFATVGTFEIVIWVGNGTQRLGSNTFRYEVFDAPGAAPTV